MAVSSREASEDPVAWEKRDTPGESVDTDTAAPLTETPDTSPYLWVVIGADGSAAVNGAAVSVATGQSVDEAILDTLHQYAIEANATVTAAISGASIEDATFVEVAPDGSSRLVESPRHEASQQGLVGQGHPVETHRSAPEAEHPGIGENLDDEAAYALSPAPVHTTRAVRQLPRRVHSERGNANAPRQSDDEFKSSSLLRKPLVAAPIAVGVAAVVIVPLILLGSGSSAEGQSKDTAGASTNLDESPPRRTMEATPTVTVSPSLLSASPSASSSEKKPKAKPKMTSKAKHTSPADPAPTATVTVTPPKATVTVTAKPAADTAATAVKQLAKNAPGRHICYRAYVSGQGWQKPVCDGTAAGNTTGNRSIKALNIAVHGTQGAAANAFVHNPKSTNNKGVWKPHWTAVTADNKDFYIGDARKDAPAMLGFAINVTSGQVCRSAHNHKSIWSKRSCVGPRPDFIFGGTLSNNILLDGIKLTV